MEKQKKIKVCHMTDAHQQEDVRIFHKECVSLAKNGFDVYLVSRGKIYEKDGVHMVGIGDISGNRLFRMTKVAKKIYKTARKIDADIYHFHDPELLLYGLKLKKMGKKVIFDSHEDVPAQIMDKYWIPKPMRSLISKSYRLLETYAVKRLDAVVAATPYIAKQFKHRAGKITVLNNYPKLDDIQYHDTPFAKRDRIMCYAGGISEIRGEKIMVEAMKDVNGTLVLAGEHPVEQVGGGYSVIRYIGALNRAGINELYGKSHIGLCVLQPTGSYVNSKPVKMYEYMAAGLPFICSDFPLWRAVAEKTRAGMCVDAADSRAVAAAVNHILRHPEEAQKMGRNGRRAVEKQYCWEKEEQKLTSLYREVM